MWPLSVLVYRRPLTRQPRLCVGWRSVGQTETLVDLPLWPAREDWADEWLPCPACGVNLKPNPGARFNVGYVRRMRAYSVAASCPCGETTRYLYDPETGYPRQIDHFHHHRHTDPRVTTS